jgi:hexosaminidase
MRTFLYCLVMAGFACAALAQNPSEISVLPMPASVQPGSGEFLVGETFAVAAGGAKDPRLDRAVERFRHALAEEIGLDAVARKVKAGAPVMTVHIDAAAKDPQQYGEDESYTLEVTRAAVRLSAPNTLGAMHGLQTFLQMVKAGPKGFAVPTVTIQDKPRYGWRGLMLDPCRHWMPVEVIKRNLDAMEAVKLNVLHWHLSEYQGFRVESKVFPKLQGMGSDGLFYTQEQIRDVVAYARDRGIRVVPEFDMPGHATAWFVGYPELASGPGPYQIERTFGVFDAEMDPTKEYVYKFLDKFIGEMSKLFPDAYWHIGGDEVNGKQWDANPQIQAFMKAHNLDDNAALQAYFNQRLEKIVSKHKKKMVGWDEIFNPALPKTIVVQSWRGGKTLAATARAGYDSLLSNGYYLDMAYPASQYYLVDPLSGDAATLTPEEQQHILGGEACMWAELVDPETVDARIWPNAAAVAERMWSPQELRDVASLYRRIPVIKHRLEFLGVKDEQNYMPMLERMADGGNAQALRVLADVVEPVKEYARLTHPRGRYDVFTPLNRLPDAAHPESTVARYFSAMVDHILAGTATHQERNTVRMLLTAWRDNDARLGPTLQNSFLLQEDAPLSQNLARIGTIGLQALDYLDGNGLPLPNWRDEQVAFLTQAAQPQAELLLKVAAPVQRLVEAVK